MKARIIKKELLEVEMQGLSATNSGSVAAQVDALCNVKYSDYLKLPKLKRGARFESGIGYSRRISGKA
jgi:hypothetical protein